MYGIYDSKLHTLVERNLPGDTVSTLIDTLRSKYPGATGERFVIVKQVDEGWLCTETVQLVALEGNTQ